MLVLCLAVTSLSIKDMPNTSDNLIDFSLEIHVDPEWVVAEEVISDLIHAVEREQSVISSLRQAIDLRQADVQATERELDSIISLDQEQQSHVEEVEKAYFEMESKFENSELVRKIDAEQSSISSLLLAIDSKQVDIREKEMEIDLISSFQQEQLSHSFQAVVSQNRSLRDKLALMIEEQRPDDVISDLIHAVEEEQNSISSLQLEIDSKQFELQDMEQEIDSVRLEQDLRIQRENDELKAELETMSSENRSLKDQITASQVINDLVQAIETEHAAISSLRIEIETAHAAVQTTELELETISRLRQEHESELGQIKHAHSVMESKLEAVVTENKSLKDQLNFLIEEQRKNCDLEQRLKTLEGEKRSVCSKMEFALKQAKKWEKIVSELSEEKDKLADQLQEIRLVNENQSKEIMNYLEQFREVTNMLKQEKIKVDSMTGQWRYYRNNHKVNEKLKKKLALQIDDFLAHSDVPVEHIREFVDHIKRRLEGEDSEDEDEDKRNENLPQQQQYKITLSNGFQQRNPLTDSN